MARSGKSLLGTLNHKKIKTKISPGLYIWRRAALLCSWETFKSTYTFTYSLTYHQVRSSRRKINYKSDKMLGYTNNLSEFELKMQVSVKKNIFSVFVFQLCRPTYSWLHYLLRWILIRILRAVFILTTLGGEKPVIYNSTLTDLSTIRTNNDNYSFKLVIPFSYLKYFRKMIKNLIQKSCSSLDDYFTNNYKIEIW